MSTKMKTSENRVQNIKKQFEIPQVEEDLPRKIINCSVYTEVKKRPKTANPHGIKRSPAFRCDKIVRGGGKTPAVSPKPISVVNKVKLFENTTQKIPITDSNYMKLDSEYRKYAICKSQENLSKVNEINHDNDLYHSHEDLTLTHSLTDSLPSGPPPKKPPRTFAHIKPKVVDIAPKPTKIPPQKSKSSQNNIIKNQNSSPKTVKVKSVNGNNVQRNTKVKETGIALKLNKSLENRNLREISPPLPYERSKYGDKPPTSEKPKYGDIKPPGNGHIRSPTNVKPPGGRNTDIKSPRVTNISPSSVKSTDIKVGSRYGDLKRPNVPPPAMPARSKTESQLNIKKRAPLTKPPNKPDLSAKTLLKSCIPLNCASAHQYEALPRRLSTKDISCPVVLPRSQSVEHIYAEPFNCSPSAGIPVKCNPPVKLVQNQPILLTKTGKQGLYYMSTPLETTWNQRPNHLPLSTSFSTPTLSLHNRGPPTPQSPPLRGHPKTPPQRAPPTPVLRECPEETDDRGSPPQKPQRSALARFASGLAKVSNVTVALQPQLDDNRIQVLMNQAFGALQLATPDVSTDSSDSLDSPVEGGFVILPPAQGGAPTTKFYPSEEEEEEEARKVVEKRKGYIRRTSSVAFNTIQRHKVQRAFVPPQTPGIFQALLLVGLKYDAESRSHVPYIKSIFPENADVPQGTELFVFPDCHDWPPLTDTDAHRTYCLVLTDSMGERIYGYCRRVLPEGASTCIPLAYCILSPHRASGFYHKVLAEVECYHGQPEVTRHRFLTQLHSSSLPTPGHSLGVMGANISRPPDPRLEERELAEMFSSLHDQLVLKLVSSLLHERKVLLISKSLSKLTSCVWALQSALYPFSWQHTLVPALPLSMIELCDAPTPFIIGILKRNDGSFPPRLIDEGMVVDLDDSRLIQCMGDENKILPQRVRRALHLALQLVASSTSPNETSRNVLVSEAFIRMFVEMCGHYKNHIVTQQDGKRVFERESFVKSVNSHCMQMFLEWFTETAMFSDFITLRLPVSASNLDQGLFERRAYEHLQEMEKSALLFLKNYKAVNKKGRTIGDRIKDWSSNF